MNWTSFTPGPALFGGALIGLAAGGLFLLSGRIAGISGICFSLLAPRKGDTGWRLFFLVGLLAGGAILYALLPALRPQPIAGVSWRLIAAGLLVGFGTSLGGGCTSGHGICGLGRLSPRSLVATITFMACGILTVMALRVLGAGMAP